MYTSGRIYTDLCYLNRKYTLLRGGMWGFAVLQCCSVANQLVACWPVHNWAIHTHLTRWPDFKSQQLSMFTWLGAFKLSPVMFLCSNHIRFQAQSKASKYFSLLSIKWFYFLAIQEFEFTCTYVFTVMFVKSKQEFDIMREIPVQLPYYRQPWFTQTSDWNSCPRPFC